ncbi:hypothetical protein E2F43_10735 [Seongchinamella unica]|uniref:Uncharacterized protein n=1 Tax=Seongchinamella unica TaxID=2547392 RepID=A0A4R5LSR1_9GAMM|nr:armadillo/beta-catenin-like repeat-containing protein [Seongchinamella unica]TDG13962.1 hypothetical protein E2F43_10735 [Seongchinamella unica]
MCAKMGPLALIGFTIASFFWMRGAAAHLDAQRVSLSQLFLGADVVVIGRIESLAERRFVLDETPTLKPVVSARVLTQYKGSAATFVEFFQEGHGHAHYVVGDTAVLFLETLGRGHVLAELGKAAGVDYVSGQVRNTEHRIEPGELPDYDGILSAYAALGSATTVAAAQRAQQIKGLILRMLESSSTGIVESGLLDWEYAGSGVQLTQAEVAELLSLTRNPSRPVNLRLAILRTMYRKQLVDDTAWTYLFQHEPDDNLILVIRSTEGYESQLFTPHLVRLLKNPSEMIVEAAARALGHPVYTGTELSLEPLLDSRSQRLNYAAVYALIGLRSEEAKSMLLDAEVNHPNPKVRRMISARLNLVSLVEGGSPAYSPAPR